MKDLGDATFLSGSPGYFMLQVLDHGTYLRINMNREATAADVAEAEKLARVALANVK